MVSVNRQPTDDIQDPIDVPLPPTESENEDDEEVGQDCMYMYVHAQHPILVAMCTCILISSGRGR